MADEPKDTMEIGYVPDEEADENADEQIEIVKEPGKKKTAAKPDQAKIRELEESLIKLTLESGEWKDKYLRTLAEADNFRKRIKKEKEEYQRFVLSEFLLELLPVYDNLERALKSKTSENENIYAGIEIIFRQFNELLRKNGVIEIEALGKSFDPVYHQALAKEERADVCAPTVVEVYQKGFIYNDKLLRPTLAKVAMPLPGATDDTLIEREA